MTVRLTLCTSGLDCERSRELRLTLRPVVNNGTYRGFLQLLQSNALIVPQIMPVQIDSVSFPKWSNGIKEEIACNYKIGCTNTPN